MHENIFKTYLARLQRFTTENYMDIYPESIILHAEYAWTKDPVPFQDRFSLSYQPITEGTTWGKEWENAWFHISGTVPESFAGKELCLRLKIDGEILLFDTDGIPVYGLTEVSAYDTNYCKERFIMKEYKSGDKIDFWFESAANRLFGIDYAAAEEHNPAHPLGSYSAVVKCLRLCVFDREVWCFLLEMETLCNLLEKTGIDDFRGKQLLQVLTKAADAYGYNPANAAAARQVLEKKFFPWKAEDGSLIANAIGHAHIDIAWLWPIRESTRKAARTFASQINLMKDYPEFKFGASQAYLYKQVKENYPGLYTKIKDMVKAGRWEIQGGMFVEADCNLISGESMVRQFLHGKNFFMDEFGVDVKTLWIPDVFGYSVAMPQIIRKSGCDYFLTQKISWNKINKFPYNTFRWFGLAGAEVLTHFPPENTYNSQPSPNVRISAMNRFNEAGILPGFMSLVGIGDGGGGPSENHIERNRIIGNIRGCPKSQWRFASDYFDEVQQYKQDLPEWHGELYLEIHRGTLTTQSRTKRGNRKCEQGLIALETLASILQPANWPRRELDSAWKILLMNQFHDIIPGSSIRQVYEQTEKEYSQILNWISEEQKRIFEQLFQKNDHCAVIINTLSCEWKGLVELPERWNSVSILDDAGKELPVHILNGKKNVFIKINGLSFQTIRMGNPLLVADTTAKTGGLVLENDLIRYEMDRNGRLIHAFDKELQKEFLTGEGNVLTLYPDRPVNWDAWDVDLFYREEKKTYPVCNSVSEVNSGSAAASVTFLLRTERSEVHQRIILNRGSKRLDFITEVDWHESRTMLRTEFPVSICSETATFDIQYAFIDRSTNNNTSWDQAKFETCGQRYADLSGRDYGVALLNDCKYGYYVKGSTLDLALLRSPKYPDRFADQGKHVFTYSFCPHAKPLAESCVMQEAANLNRNVLVADGFASGTAIFPCRLDADGISIETIKRAEKTDALIIRLVEIKGQNSHGVLSFNGTPKQIIETDLMEWTKQADVFLKQNQVAIEMHPFEIKTLKIQY